MRYKVVVAVIVILSLSNCLSGDEEEGLNQPKPPTSTVKEATDEEILKESGIGTSIEELSRFVLGNEVEIKKLIQELQKEEWEARENATKRLVSIGIPCLPYLEEENSSDVETRSRIRRIYEQILGSASTQVLRPYLAAVRLLGKSDDEKAVDTLLRVFNSRIHEVAVEAGNALFKFREQNSVALKIKSLKDEIERLKKEEKQPELGLAVEKLFSLTKDENLEPLRPKALLYVGQDENLVRELRKIPFNVTISEEIPEKLVKYCVVIVERYPACYQKTAEYLKNYIKKGGGVVLLSGTPSYFPYDAPNFTMRGHLDLSCIEEWFGAARYGNSGGEAFLAVTLPFGEDWAEGAKAAIMSGSSCAAIEEVSPKNTQIIAKWADGRVFAFTHRYGDGKVYYQSVVSEEHKVSIRLFLGGVRWAAAMKGYESELPKPENEPPTPKEGKEKEK
ncbi:MAG: hypothetical protein N2234_05145 [Planctomycetota bacterium]|nr:hypothetical protein [Planctomycetota bacterium]